MSFGDKGFALLWAAWYELNTIRARDGVPRDFNGHKVCVSEEYFSDLVDEISNYLGKSCQPWPQEYMRKHLHNLGNRHER